MLFWTVLAAMTAAATLAVLWPLSRKPALISADSASLAVYRDQLREIERDRASHMLAAAEADTARTEVARRLLRASGESEAAAAENPRRRRIASIALLLGVPAITLGLYLNYGVPEFPDAPLAERRAQPLERQDVGILIARIEERIAENPEDGRGWELIAPIYLRVGRVGDAVAARQNAIRLLGANAARETLLGETLLAAAGGTVTPDAKAAFERALLHDASYGQALYYLGLGAFQAGDQPDARMFWTRILERSAPNDPWRIPAQRRLNLLKPAS